jgi:hypothetical protein
MFPVILVSKNKEQTEDYINNFIQRHKFSPYFIFRYYPDLKIIKISQIREIKSLLVRADKNKKLIIIYDFNTAKIETQNALLKTLEEKNENAQFIIIVTNETQLLPTIASRCKTIKLKTIIFPILPRSPLLFQFLPQLLSNYSNMNKEKAMEVCDQFLCFFRKSNLSPVGCKHPTGESVTKILKEIIKVRNLIFKNNLNPQIAIDHLLIFINNCYNRYDDYKNYGKKVV